MSNSSLATYIDISTGNYNTRTQAISRITIHHAAGVGNCDMLARVLRSGRQVSYNYGIGNDGTIGLFVEENHRAWTSSNSDNDNRAVTIEVCNSTSAPNWEISPAAFNSLLNLCEDICRRNNITQLTYTGQLAGSNLTMHQWFKATACPGPYLKGKFPEIASTVTNRLRNATPGYQTGGSYSSFDQATTGVPIDPMSIIKTDAMTPYIVTIDPNTTYVNYDALRKSDIVGVMLYAGGLYNSVHLENERYRNPNLRTQVAQATQHNFPFSLYADVRARSVAEAKKECMELYYAISAFPPQLGLWLHLDLVKSVPINNEILSTYYNNIYKWGLKGRCGLYVTREELNKISWDRFNDTFFLWLNQHTSSVSEFSGLLSPELFKL